MEERLVQCEFFVPIVRNSDKKPHQPLAWILLGDEIRRVFPAGHSGPETFYRGDVLVPGEFTEGPQTPPIQDSSRRYLLAIPETELTSSSSYSERRPTPLIKLRCISLSRLCRVCDRF